MEDKELVKRYFNLLEKVSGYYEKYIRSKNEILEKIWKNTSFEHKSNEKDMNISNDEMINSLIDIETQYSNRLIRLEIDYFNIDTRKLDEELSYDLDNEKTLNKILEDENASDEIKDCIKIYREAADLSHELYKLEKIEE